MPLIAAFFVRIARAAQVLWLLVADGSTRRRLPWPYLRRRVSRDPIMMVQLTGIAAAALFYPASFLLPEPARGPTIAGCFALWLIAAFGPLLRERHRKR